MCAAQDWECTGELPGLAGAPDASSEMMEKPYAGLTSCLHSWMMGAKSNAITMCKPSTSIRDCLAVMG